MTKHDFMADIVRRALTDAEVDLRHGSKREIERVIADALDDGEKRWPVYISELAEREACFP